MLSDGNSLEVRPSVIVFKNQKKIKKQFSKLETEIEQLETLQFLLIVQILS